MSRTERLVMYVMVITAAALAVLAVALNIVDGADLKSWVLASAAVVVSAYACLHGWRVRRSARARRASQ